MKYTSNIKLCLPDLGSTDNWGSAINYNFIAVDRAMNKIYSELANVKTLMGGKVPYYSELYTESETSPQPYKFLYIAKDDTYDNEYQFIYCTTPYPGLDEDTTDPNTDPDAPDEYKCPTKTYYSHDYGNAEQLHINQIPVGTGAYLLNNDPEGGPWEINTANIQITAVRGDLLVFVQQIGSIHNPEYGTNTLKKYPDTGFFIDPTVAVINNDVVIKYTHKTYPDYVIRDTEETYTAVPAFHFIEGNLDKVTQIVKTVKVAASSPDECGVMVHFYDNSNYPMYVDYIINKNLNSANHELTVTIQLDSTLQNNAISNLKYCLYIGHSLTAHVVGDNDA